MSQWITNERRLAIYLRDSFTCVWCLDSLCHAAAEEITLDHIIPRSKGGSHDSFNLVTSCRRCNSSRQDDNHKLHAKHANTKPGAIQRINSQRRMKPNFAMAKLIIAGTTPKAEALAA